MTFLGTWLENKSLLSFPCLTSYIHLYMFFPLKLKKWIVFLQEYSIIHNVLFMRYSYWKIKIFYLLLVLIYIFIRFLPLKFKKWIGVLQEYSIIHNVLLYDIRISEVNYYACTTYIWNMKSWNLDYVMASVFF